MPRLRGALRLLGVVALAAGCAAPRPLLRPSDFPMHTTAPPFTIHWRLVREGASVMAVGIVEVGAPDRIEAVTVELEGFDADGRLVARGRDTASARSFTGVEPWPFAASLRPTGREERFAVTVVDVTWKRALMGGPGGR